MRQNRLIQMYITNMCNSHCSTCGIWKNKERQELDVNTIEDVVRAFPDADYVIGGGEAILHLHIDEILSMLKYYDTKYTLLSNCIDVQKLRLLVELYDVPAVTVSFDGFNHDKIRGSKGNTNKILYFKQWCEKQGVGFKLSYTLSKFNEKDFKSDMKMIRDLFGQKQIYFCLAQDMDLLETGHTGSFVATDLQQVVDCNMLTYKDLEAVKAISGKCTRAICSSQNHVNTIYSNGDVVRCQSFMSKDVIGNVKGKEPAEIKKIMESIENIGCTYDSQCNLLCQRRYDYE